MCIELRTNSIQSLKLRLKVFLAQSRSRQKNGQRLQCAAQVIDFVNILGAECARPETAPGIRTYQSFLNEPLQCLAHRCAAHSQLFSQSDIRNSLPQAAKQGKRSFSGVRCCIPQMRVPRTLAKDCGPLHT